MATKSGSANSKLQAAAGSRKCLCSPTTHPGSFRCSFHRNRRKVSAKSSSAAEIAMFAKSNALRAFLQQIIKPSSNDLQRRRNFRPKPSRFKRTLHWFDLDFSFLALIHNVSIALRGFLQHMIKPSSNDLQRGG